MSSPLDVSKMTELFKLMVKIRLTEERVSILYPSDKIQSPVHLCIGQEAVSAGVCLALEPGDHLYGTYRGHGIYLAKGGTLKKLFAELYAKDTGCARGKGGSMHLIAPEAGFMGASAIVASTIPLAAGDALAARMLGQKRVAVAFFGDGAVDEGIFFETMNFAALKKLPMIFVCENNNYAVHSRVADRHRETELYKFGEGLGIKGFRYDGNDAAAVYSSMMEHTAKIRNGGEPVLLEYLTYRISEHVGPGKDLQEKYRDRQKLDEAMKDNPIERTKKILKEKFAVPEDAFTEWERLISQEIDEAVAFAEVSPLPAPERLYEDLFKEK